MIYDKLDIILLSTIMSEPQSSTNSMIATYIIEHMDDMKDLGIQDISKLCHVSNSSISRFCKEVGFKDFNELKSLIKNTSYSFYETDHYKRDIIKELDDMSVSIDKIKLLVNDIMNYKNIAIFGLLKAQCAAICLQCDLLQLHKSTYTNVNVYEQMNYMLESDDSLIIIFSYTGSYFDNIDIRSDKKYLYRHKIWMICGDDDVPDYVDHTITFNSHLNQLGHPYQLECIAGMIAQEYKKRIDTL